MAIPFHQLLRRFVERFEAAHPEVSRRQIAGACKLTASQLSQYMSDNQRSRRKPPGSRARVIAIADGLQLSERDRNTLLEAAGHPPDGYLEQILRNEPVRALHDLLEKESALLPSPDREALAETLTMEASDLLASWRRFFDLRRQLYERHWPDVANVIDRQLDDGYWGLRHLAVRYRARLSLLAASAQYHVGDATDAIAMVRVALEAARDADAPMLECQAHVRFGDIRRSLGEYEQSFAHYRDALRVLERWTDKTPTQEAWAEHWSARTDRKIAALSLFQGKPAVALPLLWDCARRFRKMGRDYELSRTLFSLGWANNYLGNWDAALDAYREGMELTAALAERRGGDDPRQLVEGHLCLAGVFWNRREIGHLEEHLAAARDLLFGDRAAAWNGSNYHEVGRFWLLQGRLHQERGGPDAADQARAAFKAGIAFQTAQVRRDPTRIASLHVAMGLLEWEQNSPGRALQEFQKALDQALGSIPPNAYYMAEALVHSCGIALGREDDRARRAGKIEEARSACIAGEYWQKLALLERYGAEGCLRRSDLDGFADHATRAIVAGSAFNRDTAVATVEALRRAVLASALPPSDQGEALALARAQVEERETRGARERATLRFLAALLAEPSVDGPSSEA